MPDVAFKGSRKKVAELSVSSSYLGDGWIEYASGSGGNGEGTLSATNSDQGEPAARYVQKTPLQNGLPSITKLAGDALTYAESSKTINFRAESNTLSRYQLLVSRFRGNGIGAGADVNLERLVF